MDVSRPSTSQVICQAPPDPPGWGVSRATRLRTGGTRRITAGIRRVYLGEKYERVYIPCGSAVSPHTPLESKGHHLL